MNWIEVIFDEIRGVIVDGNPRPIGNTNKLLLLGEAGTYTISLDGPQDYTPSEQDVEVSGTSRRHPCVITFEKD